MFPLIIVIMFAIDGFYPMVGYSDMEWRVIFANTQKGMLNTLGPWQNGCHSGMMIVIANDASDNERIGTMGAMFPMVLCFPDNQTDLLMVITRRHMQDWWLKHHPLITINSDGQNNPFSIINKQNWSSLTATNNTIINIRVIDHHSSTTTKLSTDHPLINQPSRNLQFTIPSPPSSTPICFVGSWLLHRQLNHELTIN